MKSRPSGITAIEAAIVLDITPQAVGGKAKSLGWKPIGRVCPGGIVFNPASVSAEINLKVLDLRIEQSIKSAPNDRPAPAGSQVEATAVQTGNAAVPSAELRTWQRACMDARAALLAEVKRIGAEVGTERAIRAVVKLARDGGLPAHLQRLVPVANARSGKRDKRTLSRGSLCRWLGQAKQGMAALAPKPSRSEAAIPAWLPALLAIYQRPTKPSLAFCLEELCKQLPAGVKAPSQSAAWRWVKRISPVDLARGRMGARELKTIRPFVRRDSSHMWPGDCYTADGHTFDAEVAHPAHGRPFRPEITGVLDIATRRCVGWSAGLAESTWAVLDAQRHAIERCGIPALWYVDRGSGYLNAMQTDLAVGFAARIGMTITHSIAYNSQARGVMERSHQSMWVRAAKRLPTYMGAAMDREAKQKVFKLTRADIKTAGASRLLMPWIDFLAFCQAAVDEYNDHPHRSLPRIRDASTGKMRHMSPNEAWQAAIDEGWAPAAVSPEESADLFRPYRICSVIRGEVRLFNNTYFSKALEHYHGDRVQVGYDIHDASRVWVRDQAGRLLCVAEFEANSRAYFPQSVIDQAAERRAKGRIRRAEAKIEEAEAELDPPALEHQAPNVIEQSLAIPSEQVAADALPDNVVALQAAIPTANGGRPRFADDLSMLAWLAEHRAEMDDYDWDWMVERAGKSQTFDREWRRLFGPGAGSSEAGSFEAAAR